MKSLERERGNNNGSGRFLWSLKFKLNRCVENTWGWNLYRYLEGFLIWNWRTVTDFDKNHDSRKTDGGVLYNMINNSHKFQKF